MLKTVLAVLTLLVATPSYSACVWSATTTWSAKVVCDSGTEAAPTLITEGISLVNLRSLSISMVADSGQTFTAAPAGMLWFYVWDDVAEMWIHSTDFDRRVTNASERTQGFTGLSIIGPRGGRVAVRPVGISLSSGKVTVYLNGQS
jgi:hypothetical protein